MNQPNESFDSVPEKSDKPLCLNCDKKMPRKATFCPNCGQRNNQGKVTMRELLGKVWLNIFHVNGRLLSMSRHLFVPGLVSKEYFRGRQRRYPHPFQFFFVVMFLFLFSVNHFWETTQRKNESAIKINIGASDKARKQSTETKSVENFLDRLKQHAQNLQWLRAYRQLPENLKTPDAKILVDTLFHRQFKNAIKLDLELNEKTDSINLWSPEMDSLPLTFGIGKKNVAIEDLAFDSMDKLLEKYPIEIWWQRILFKQSIKSIREFKSLQKSILASMTWTILVLVGVMSLLLALFYRKQNRYFVEHFVFQLHVQTGLMLGMMLAIVFNYFTDFSWIWGVFVIWALVHQFLAMRNFYGQTGGKLWAKFLIFSLLYVVFFSLLFGLGIVMVFILL